METKKLDESYETCIRSKFDSHGSPLWLLIKEMYLSFKSFCTSESDELLEIKKPVDEWLTPEELVQKYPVFSTSMLRTFVRHAPNDLRNAMSHRNSELDTIVIMPRLLFQYIESNKESFRKINNRLKQHDYFGFNINKEEKNGQENKSASEGNKEVSQG